MQVLRIEPGSLVDGTRCEQQAVKVTQFLKEVPDLQRLFPWTPDFPSLSQPAAEHLHLQRRKHEHLTTFV